MTFDENSILSVTAEGPSETPNIGTLALEQLPDAILQAQSAEVDAIASATITSNALLGAAAICIQQARGEYVEPEQEAYPTEADVLVLGGGASGLAAATAAGQAGASVIVLEAGSHVGGPSKPEASSALNASQLVVNLNGRRFWKNTTDTSPANTKAMTYIAANQPEGVALFVGDEKMIADLKESTETGRGAASVPCDD